MDSFHPRPGRRRGAGDTPYWVGTVTETGVQNSHPGKLRLGLRGRSGPTEVLTDERKYDFTKRRVAIRGGLLVVPLTGDRRREDI